MIQSVARSPSLDQLLQAIQQRHATVAIVGMGYVGLPLANAFVSNGFSVLGFDTDDAKIAALGIGESYIRHVPSDWIRQWNKSQRFSASSDPASLSAADAILICVPTPLSESRDPDLRFVESAARVVAQSLRPGQLVVLESTTYPGTTRDVVLPILAATGWKLGVDFFLAYSPEREDPGNAHFSAANIPKVVGGAEPNSLRLADALYSAAVTKTVPVSSCEVAEACKILENTYRCVNIALVNELKMLFDRVGIDVWEVIDAAKTKPFGFQAFYPGPGLGGHCIPIDPFYLSWLARKEEMTTKFIELAGEVNTHMPAYVVERVAAALNDQERSIRGSKIVVLGAAYKKDIDDARESPSLKLIAMLAERGAVVSYNDPYIPKLPTDHGDLPSLTSQELTPEFLSSQHLALIATDHSCYDGNYIVAYSRAVLDTRNLTRRVLQARDKIYSA